MRHIITLLILASAAGAQTIPKNQRDALFGANGQSPSGNNRYVCDKDPRLATTGLGSVVVQHNGVTIGTASALNFEGSGVVSISMPAGSTTASLDFGGGGSGGAGIVSGFMSGLDVEQSSNSTINIIADVIDVTDASNELSVTSVNVTCDVTASGAGGLDTGTVASSTWYYLYLVTEDDGTLPVGLMSLSRTSPTMPGTKTRKRLVSPFRVNGSTHIVSFRKIGTKVDYRWVDSTPGVALNSGGSTSFSTIDFRTFCPPGCRDVCAFAELDSSNGGLQWREAGATGQEWNIATTPGRQAAVYRLPISTSQMGDYKVTGGGSLCYIYVHGFYYDF